MTHNEVTADAALGRWLNWWLQPRWRALLTWVALAAIGEWITRHYSSAESAMFFYEQFVVLVPFGLPVRLNDFAVPLTTLVLVTWFQAVALRIGGSRAAVWVAIIVVLWALALALIFVSIHLSRSVAPIHRWIQAAFLGQFLGLGGVTVMGRRTRPWMSVIGGALATGLAYQFIGEAGLAPPWLLVGTNVIYGAVMIYGTDLLPRRPAERQFAEDQR